MVQDGVALPLEGVRVVEHGSFVAIPLAGMLLAQLGAEVVRLDPAGGAADLGRLPRSENGESIYWASLNKGKRSVALNLRNIAGRELATRLITDAAPDAGVFLTNVIGRPWLADEELRTHREDLVHVQLTGTPNGGAAVDYTINAATGVPLLTGPGDLGVPVNHVLPAWDVAAGELAALAAVALERQRARTGSGGHLRLSLADVAVSTLGHLGFLAERSLGIDDRDRDGNFVYGTFGTDFPTADGERVMVVAITPRQWRELVAITGLEEAVAALEQGTGVDLDDEAGRFELREALAALLRPWFAARTAEEVAATFADAAVLVQRYRTVDELVHACAGEASALESDRAPEGNARPAPEVTAGVVSWLDQPGIGRLLAAGSALSTGGRSIAPPTAAPTFGGDTEPLLAEVLGLSRTELGRARDAGAFSSG
ncbi:2-methylfumaryl-CoA isomerase [Egibacter rhizosphaerae]|uniref:2-methylfumaryl-CoA isomerase n=1 Tax=Egibacter rhizosphaerae TaxID=1670831 RepID=A0A411YE87_9ACTN|nr:CoA transferase [Egibacter rhizosphaerae]QBI19535.1 2-methylfumaryl-CoA isomerase [Egibacter rhizosphaerae]